MTKQISNSLAETQKIAGDFIEKVEPKKDEATVVGLYGNLGAGKTTFTQCVAKALSVDETVTSPTFVIEKIYGIVASSQYPVARFKNLIHIDAYRIEKPKELEVLGWEEIISDPTNLILVEWPERIADIMPEHIKVNLDHISENSREIEILE